jgi:hypothetical protein
MSSLVKDFHIPISKLICAYMQCLFWVKQRNYGFMDLEGWSQDGWTNQGPPNRPEFLTYLAWIGGQPN